ncbi:MAG: flavodoxin family protein [Desulfobacterales bacterium]|nr:flavodoxin family protein [Desulfobacterales bacterium]
MKILAIVSSPHPGGNSSDLVDIALEEAKKHGVEVEKEILIEKQIGWCLGHEECGSQPGCLHAPDDGTELAERLFSADGILLSSPVHMRSISAIMKNFMTRTRFKGIDNSLCARSVGLVAVASNSGIEETLDDLENYVTRRSSISPEKILKVGGRAKKPGDAKANPELVQKARQLGRKMAEELKRPS